jgi:hypothetical protein
LIRSRFGTTCDGSQYLLQIGVEKSKRPTIVHQIAKTTFLVVLANVM